jgi:hypothetical protein
MTRKSAGGTHDEDVEDVGAVTVVTTVVGGLEGTGVVDGRVTTVVPVTPGWPTLFEPPRVTTTTVAATPRSNRTATGSTHRRADRRGFRGEAAGGAAGTAG